MKRMTAMESILSLESGDLLADRVFGLDDGLERLTIRQECFSSEDLDALGTLDLPHLRELTVCFGSTHVSAEELHRFLEIPGLPSLVKLRIDGCRFGGELLNALVGSTCLHQIAVLELVRMQLTEIDLAFIERHAGDFFHLGSFVKPAPVSAERGGDPKQRRDLEAMIDADPSDPERWLVYADHLQSIGDQLGELIVLYHRKSDFESAWTSQREELFGDDADQISSEQLRGSIRIAWHMGFAAYLAVDGDTGLDPLARLLKLPVCRFVRGLDVDFTRGGATPEVLSCLGRHRSRLEQLTISSWADPDRLYPSDLDVTWYELASLSALTSLDLSGRIAVQGFEHPRLERLSLSNDNFLPDDFLAMGSLRMPRLRELSIGCHGKMSYAEEAELGELFAVRGLPSLKELTVYGCRFTDLLLRGLVGSACLKRLEELDLATCDFDERDRAFLREHAADFAHLKKFVT